MNTKRFKNCSLIPQRRCLTLVLTIVLALVAGVDTARAQRGRGRGFGGGRGPGANPGMRADMTTLHAMFADRSKIKRTVKMLPGGAEALTESDDAEIVSLLQEHVPAMEGRVHENDPLPPMTFHPIFVNLIKHADDYTLTYEDTEKGVKVTYEAKDPFVIMLVQEHAKLVSRFIKNGMEEIHKPYTLPKKKSLAPTTEPEQGTVAYVNPVIRDYGKVVNLPNAAHQPRSDSKIVVDITKGGDPDKLNPAIEKVCRFVNIYAGAGKDPAKVEIAVVLHGDATLAVLNDSAYSAHFDAKTNPNLNCLKELNKAGVEVFVCGQSLIGKDAKPSQVSEQAKVAVSALTALVNLQSDGFAYLPMLK